MKISSALIAIFFASTLCYGSQIGLSTHPLESNQRLLNTEYVGKVSHGSASGIQARYMQTFHERFSAEGGFRVFQEDVTTYFAGATYEVYPDYGNQPRISLKGFYERERIDAVDYNNFGVAPIISKGFSFWGYPGYPYMAIPIKLSLDEDTEEYDMVTSLSLGISAELPFEGFENVLGNIEGNVDISGSYSYVSMGIAMNFQ
ncbi:MAG: hypothetical protein H6621_04840 [Halobacteriovoraceae bacterium]|nr:hypothetical protein [Halobacteriovoraceae bacterium]